MVKSQRIMNSQLLMLHGKVCILPYHEAHNSIDIRSHEYTAQSCYVDLCIPLMSELDNQIPNCQ